MECALKNTKCLLSATLIAVLTACGGGGGGDSSSSATTPTSTILTGTAATGAALSNAKITVKDSKGASKTATADANGNFSVDVTGMTAPLIIQAVSQDASKTFYSISQTIPESNVINVTSITDSLAQASGSAPATLFADPATKLTSVDFAKLKTAQDNLKTALTAYMTTLGISTTTDLVTSAFLADNSKVDALLDCLSSTAGTLSVKASCTGGAAVQAFDPAVNATTVPAQLAAPTAGTLDYLPANLPLINAQIKLLSNAWSGTSGDLATVLTAAFDADGVYDNGMNRAAFIADQVAKFKAGDRVTLNPGALVGFDKTANTVDMCLDGSTAEGGQAAVAETTGATFKKINGIWQVTTESSAARSACEKVSAKQATIRAVTSNYSNVQGKLATVLPTKYAVCIGKAPRVNDGGTLTSEALCGSAGLPLATFDVSSWKPVSGTLSLVAYFVEISSKTVIAATTGLTLDSTGGLNHRSQDVCAGHSQYTTCTPAAGVQ